MRTRWPLWMTSIRGLFGRSAADRGLTDELAFHLGERTEHWIRQGLTPPEAERRARIEFGSFEAYRERGRDAKGFRPLDEARTDLRYAWRQLRKSPVFSVIAVAVFAIAIGANTAIFSALDGTLWRRLPVTDAAQLRELAWLVGRDGYELSYDGSMRPDAEGRLDATSFSYSAYSYLRDRSTVFSDLVIFARHDQMNFRIKGQASLVSGLLVSGNFSRGIGVPMALGRAFGPDDDRPGAPGVVVLSYDNWQRLFSGDPGALGASVTINGTAATVVGVTARGFFGLEPGRPVEVLAPIVPFASAFYPQGHVLATPNRWWFRVIGRLADGVGDERANTETTALLQQAIRRDSVSIALEGVAIRDVSRGLDSLRRDHGTQLRLLTGIAAVILIVACVNIAGLLVTRTAARQREMVIRRSLGASAGRVVRQVLTESLLLAALGGAAGVAAALVVRHRLLPLLNQGSQPIELALGVDLRLVVFSVALCAGVGLFCGVLPAVLIARRRPSLAVVRAVGSSSGRTPRLFAGKTLTTIQVALSVLLLAGGGLLTRTLLNLRSQPLGFNADRLLLFEVDATLSGYENTRLLDFYEQALTRVQALPGVVSASFSRHSLLSGATTSDTIDLPGIGPIDLHVHFVGPRYFETMGIAVRVGREFDSGDRERSARVAIVNTALAQKLGSQSVGGRIHYGERSDPDAEIIGVVGDARYDSVREPVRPTLYLPYRQYRQHRMIFAARTAGDPKAIVPTVRYALEALDPGTPLFHVLTQHELNTQAWRQERIVATVVLAAAALAVILACLGIYGSLSYAVTERTQEIGLRMALGAHPERVVRLILRESLAAVTAGLIVGVAGAAAATRLIGSLLFGVAPFDLPTFTAAVVAVLGCALFAAWLPSRRASRIEPVVALRRD